MAMFQIILSGPPVGAESLIGSLNAAGFPAALDPTRQGFPERDDGTLIYDEMGEPLRYAYDGDLLVFVECVPPREADWPEVEEIAARFGYRVRMHSMIDDPDWVLVLRGAR
jgi:hypothetical protein